MIKAIKLIIFNSAVFITLVVIADLILWRIGSNSDRRIRIPQEYISLSFFLIKN